MSQSAHDALRACEQEAEDLPMMLGSLILLAQQASHDDADGLTPDQCRGLYIMLCDAQDRARKIKKAWDAGWDLA